MVVPSFPPQSGAPVVAAVGDVDAAGQAAVEWAAAEAAVRRRPLRVVHVVRRPPVIDPCGLVPVPDGVLLDRALGREVLRGALDRAAAVASDLEVSADLYCGSPARVLLELSTEAALLVLGCRGRSSHRLLPTSVAEQVALRACCPVVVVPCGSDEHPGPGGPRVVVGIDLAHCSAQLLEVAFGAAAQRGVPLVAVHAWGRDFPADLEGVCCPSAATERGAGEQLDHLLAPWQERFPDVPVRGRLVVAHPAAALGAESDGASLLVVGSRSRGVVRSTLFGSVNRSLLQRVRVPVAVVHPALPAQARAAGGTARARRPPDVDRAPTEPDPGPGSTWG
jgi:nucleotide-binding universal stress UspA family protein